MVYKKSFKKFISLIIIAALFMSSTVTASIEFDPDLYRTVKKDKEEKTYEQKDIEKIDIPDSQKKYIAKSEELTELEGNLVDVSLPYQSNLNISGRKMIAFDYGVINYADEEKKLEAPSDISEGIQMNQELQMRINGTIGNKIRVGIDYDDTGAQLDQQDISIVYTGYKKGDVTNPNDVKKGKSAVLAEKDEVIQEVAFGNIQLSLPKTEFFGYDKTLFGLRLKAKYKNFNITAIGSQTEGITEKKVFRGNTSQEHKSIQDTHYIKRKYYKIAFDSSHLPIQKNSDEIYLYNQSGTNTGVTLYDFAAEEYGGGITENAAKAKIFKKLSRGTDYEVDYIEGTINFKTTINSNYIIGINYTPKNSTSKIAAAGKLVLLKDAANTLNYEIKSFYYLGNTNIIRGDLGQDFIFRVLDANEVTQNFSYEDVEIDYLNGILKFKNDEPFKNLNGEDYNFYNNENMTSRYSIDVQYNYEKADNFTYVLAKTIIIGSEDISLDGVKLKRDIDYIIDYDIGLISLINTARLTGDSVLEITYEYLPFGGQQKQTLLGAQGSYGFMGNSHIGAGVIYTGSNKPKQAPGIFSTPSSISVFDSDMELNLNQGNSFMPFPVKIKGEVAQSKQNPNIFGKAIIENMESSDEMSVAATNEKDWQVAANPSGTPLNDLDKLTISNATVELETIYNEAISSSLDLDDLNRDVEVLNIGYSNLAQNEELSIVDVLSKVGVDYSEKTKIQFFVRADETFFDQGAELALTYGQIDEDTDGSGDLSTEDKDGDGKLGVDEDIGWEYKQIETFLIGAGNARLDSEDLDNNGTLDPEGIIHTSAVSLTNSTEWQKITIPLNIDPNDSSEVEQWKYIKHLRLTIKNPAASNISGNIQFYQIAAKGNKWKETHGNMKVDVINKESDSSYEPISNTSIYEELYGTSSSDDDSSDVTESALELTYEDLEPLTSNTTGYYTIYRLPSNKKYDLSKYGDLKFFLKGDGQNVTFFMQIGADENNYFEYAQEVGTDNNWQIPKISLDDKRPQDGIPDSFQTYKGSPSLDNVKFFKLGIRNTESSSAISGTIYVNDIFVENVKAKKGNAYKGEIELTPISGFKLSGRAKHIDADFETLTTGTQDEGLASSNSITSGQEIDKYDGTLEISRFAFMPTKIEASSVEKITPKHKSNAFSIKEEGKTSVRSGAVTTRLLFGSKVPTFDFNVSRTEGKFFDLDITKKDPYVLDEKQVRDYYFGSTSYDLPITSKYYKQKIFGTYKYQKTTFDFYDTTENHIFSSKEDLEEKSTAGTDLFLFNNRLTLKPKYEILKVTELRNHADESERFLRKREEKVELDSEVVLLKWLRPQFSYDIIKKEDYNVENSTAPITTKDLSLENRGSAKVDIYFKAIFPNFKPTQSMSLDTNYGIKDINAWDNVDKNYDLENQWFTRDLLIIQKDCSLNNLDTTPLGESLSTKQVSFTKEDTKSFSLKWSPLDWLKYNEHWFVPIKNMSTRLSYTKTTTDSLSSYKTQEIWPEILLGLKEFENLIRVHRFVSKGDMTITYLKKSENTKNTSDKFTNDLSTNYRFSFLRKFDCALKYNYKKYEEFDLNLDIEQNNLLNQTLENIYALQVGLNYKIWRFSTRYDYFDKTEILTNTSDKAKTEHALSLKADVDFNSTKGLKIPFVKKRIKVDNRIRVNSELKGSMLRGSLLEENKNTYAFILDSEYNFTSYLQCKLGGEYVQVEFTKSPDSNYNAAKIKTEVSIIF